MSGRCGASPAGLPSIGSFTVPAISRSSTTGLVTPWIVRSPCSLALSPCASVTLVLLKARREILNIEEVQPCEDGCRAFNARVDAVGIESSPWPPRSEGLPGFVSKSAWRTYRNAPSPLPITFNWKGKRGWNDKGSMLKSAARTEPESRGT